MSAIRCIHQDEGMCESCQKDLHSGDRIVMQPGWAEPLLESLHSLTFRCGRCCACFLDSEAACDGAGGYVRFEGGENMSLTVLPDGTVRIKGNGVIAKRADCSKCGHPVLDEKVPPYVHVTFA